jgi:hypothetical protein
LNFASLLELARFNKEVDVSLHCALEVVRLSEHTLLALILDLLGLIYCVNVVHLVHIVLVNPKVEPSASSEVFLALLEDLALQMIVRVLLVKDLESLHVKFSV